MPGNRIADSLGYPRVHRPRFEGVSPPVARVDRLSVHIQGLAHPLGKFTRANLRGGGRSVGQCLSPGVIEQRPPRSALQEVQEPEFDQMGMQGDLSASLVAFRGREGKEPHVSFFAHVFLP